MPASKSHSPTRSRPEGAHGGGGDGHHDDEGGGGGGGGGKLVKVAFARNQAEAEMLQGLLVEAGIPSVLKRSRGFDAPEFAASGPHDVMVPAELARKARDLLADTLVDSDGNERAELDEEARLRHEGTATSARTLAIWIGVAFVVAVILVWVL